MKAALRLTWRALGSVKLDSKRKLRFPLTTGPNVYRLIIERSDGSRSEYIGETKDFETRFSAYRNPGPTQWTNRRVNQLCIEVLSDFGKVSLEIVDEAWIESNGIEEAVNFESKRTRRLIESLVLVLSRSDEVECLNF